MRLTIIAEDDLVIVDGDARRVDCAALRAKGVHAVQWDNVEGAVEYRHGPQVWIGSLAAYRSYKVAHATAPKPPALAAPGRDLAAELDALKARVVALEAKP